MFKDIIAQEKTVTIITTNGYHIQGKVIEQGLTELGQIPYVVIKGSGMRDVPQRVFYHAISTVMEQVR